MPTATDTAPIRLSIEQPCWSAPKATPTASPSGMLWMVMDSTSRMIRRTPPLSTFPRERDTSLSDAQRNSAPVRNPMVATNHAGSPGSCSALAMAGSKSDQKLAAIMTPAEKPSMRFRTFGRGDVKKTTVAAPRAVTNHVPSVAISAIRTKEFISHLLSPV